jgi:glycosyltransferase involved in cell wall biosynthesis
MKILVVAPTPFFSDRGTHIRILEESLALEKLGHQITIATYHIGKDPSQEVKTKIDVRRIRRLLFWYKKLEAGPDWQKILLDLMLIRKVFTLARTQKPDILHGHLHEGVIIAWIVQKLLFWRPMKLVADFHGSLTREMVSHGYLGMGMLKKLFSWLEKIIDNLGDYTISSSWENSQQIRNVKKDEQVETVSDGVNLDYYRNLPPKIESKKELELPLDKVIVAYTGALIQNKGIKYLQETILQVLKNSSDVFFMVAGFPAEEITAFIKANSLEQSVRLVSPLNYFDLPQILNASDIGIDPKDSESRQASGKILQYMGAGLPVVCFDRENNREYLGAGAYYGKEISADGLVEGIQYFLKNRGEIEAKGGVNQERAKNFSWDKSARAISEIYQKIV